MKYEGPSYEVKDCAPCPTAEDAHGALEWGDLQFKADDAGHFSGYGSTWDLDRQGEVVDPGAFKRTLDRNHGRGFPLLWCHSPEEPIGIVTKAVEDARGLKIEGDLILQVQRAAEAYALMKRGVVSGFSIGFRCHKDRWVGNVRHLVEVELHEISAVPFPANPKAQLRTVKSDDLSAPGDPAVLEREAQVAADEADVPALDPDDPAAVEMGNAYAALFEGEGKSLVESFAWLDGPSRDVADLPTEMACAEIEPAVRAAAEKALAFASVDLCLPLGTRIAWGKPNRDLDGYGVVLSRAPHVIWLNAEKLAGRPGEALATTLHEAKHVSDFGLGFWPKRGDEVGNDASEWRAIEYTRDAVDRLAARRA